MIYIAIAVDLFHAAAMVAWIVGLPFLFYHKYPRISFAYGCFALLFIVVNLTSQKFLGECVITTIANYFYQKAGVINVSDWFTVRLSRFVFGLTPSHRGVKLATEFFIGVAAVGGLISTYKALKFSGKAPKNL